MTSEKLNDHLNLFGLKSFHVFLIFGREMGPFFLPWVLFAHKNGENSLQKPISSTVKSGKIIQKTSKYSNGTHKKRQMLFHRYLDKYTLFLTLPPPFFEEEGVQNFQKRGRRRDQFFKELSEQKRRVKWKRRTCRGNGIFSF